MHPAAWCWLHSWKLAGVRGRGTDAPCLWGARGWGQQGRQGPWALPELLVLVEHT